MRLRAIVALASFAVAVPATAAAAPPQIGGLLPGHSAPLRPGTVPYHADFLAGRPQVGKISASRLVNGRLAVRVSIVYPKLHKHWTEILDDDANYEGRVALSLNAGEKQVLAHETKAVPLGSVRQGGRVVQELVLSTASTRRLLARGDRLSVSARVTGMFDQFGDGRPEERANASTRRTIAVGTQRVTAAENEGDFPCKAGADLTPTTFGGNPNAHLLYYKLNVPIHYDTGPIRFRLCTWSGTPLVKFPWFDYDGDHDFPGRTNGGTLGDPRVEDGYVTITFTPAPNLDGLGQTSVLFAVDGIGNSIGYDVFKIHMYFRPFEMRATGDSITAGWGYLGNGSPPQLSGSDEDFDAIVMQLCSPNGDSYSNKCSSNSAAGRNDDNTDHRFNDDTGLANNVSWAAQFAARHHITRKSANGQYLTYGNYAVSGARPEHYLPADGNRPAGRLWGVLQQWILDYHPDLTVMTLGANPILANFLTDSRWGDEKCGNTDGTNYQARYQRAVGCMGQALREEDVYGRLRAIYRRLLDIPYNRIFVAQYPMGYPSLQYYAASRAFVNQFDPWVFEALATRLNQEIARAVNDEAALARSQGKGDRLFIFAPPRADLGTRGLRQILGTGTGITCPADSSITNVDGLSRQSAATQSAVRVCKSGEFWFESLDAGIHLSRTGASKLADALDEAIREHGVRVPG